MHLFAKNDCQLLIHVLEAESRKDYFCCDCGSVVRKREGEVRSAHFYHLGNISNCGEHQTSLRHLHTQYRLQKLIAGVEIEVRKEAIGRIADVLWEKEKIVFEVQVSPISQEEIFLRNSDWKQLGYTVVWILHDSFYNKRYLRPAEWALKDYPHYFSNIDRTGRGFIYDQPLNRNKRMQRAVSLDTPKWWPSDLFLEGYQHRLEKIPLYFKGDFIDIGIVGKPKKRRVNFSRIRSWYWSFLARLVS